MIFCKSPKEIEILRKSNQVVALVLKELKKNCQPGITTLELDQLADRLINKNHCIPAFKGYRNYPASLCISVNEEIVHGIPGERKLKNGDIVSLDIGVKLDGLYGDAAITVPVGKIDPESQKLLQVTEEALYKGIEKAHAGNRLSDISHAIQTWVEKHHFSVVRDFVGHGIGKNLHEEPQIPNFGKPGFGPRLREGMVLALEPMVNVGTYAVRILRDGWTAVTADGSRSAHFEHSVAITNNGPLILSEL
ncbi:MAG: type I methionyl aminopeptidase [Thermodesulfobacteriota bacterium]|jgi:methionyl aminopeptidase|nr:MAG: type I methionyl aminopeptidase [Thermodesulfobacteriota bacterium]